MNQFAKRNWYNIQRFRSITYTSMMILTLLFFIVGAFYPGDSDAAELIDAFKETGLDTIYGLSNVSAIGWLFWLALICNTYLYFVPVIAAILVGSRLVPTKDNDGLELLFASTPRNKKKFVIENLLGGAQILFLILVPSFVVISIFTWNFADLNILDRIAKTFFLSYLVSLFFMVSVTAISTIRFSNSEGKKYGFGYLVFCFFYEIFISTSKDLSDLGNLSINYYIRPSDALLNTDYEITKAFVVLFLISIGIIVSLMMVERHDYIEKISEPKSAKSGTTKFHPNSNLGKKYPFIAEQLRRDFKFISWNIGLVAFFILYIVVIYPGDEQTRDIFTSFQNPIIDALLFGHSIPFNYTGFIVVEFYAYLYMYFGIFVTFAAASIATKEVREDYQDIIWANNFKPDEIIKPRTKTLLIEITALFWSSFVFLQILELTFGYSSYESALNGFFVFSLNWVLYMSYAIFIISTTMRFQLSESKKYALWIYFGFILLILIAFLTEYEYLRYLSYFGYIDNVGIMFEEISLIVPIISTLVITPISYVFYKNTLYNHFWNKDLL